MPAITQSPSIHIREWMRPCVIPTDAGKTLEQKKKRSEAVNMPYVEGNTKSSRFKKKYHNQLGTCANDTAGHLLN